MLNMAGMENVWICAKNLQLIRADRVVSLLVPFAVGYDAASPDDPSHDMAIYVEVVGGSGGDCVTRVKLADCADSSAAELLADLACVLGSVGRGDEAGHIGCTFVFADKDAAGRLRWVTASHLPASWPQTRIGVFPLFWTPD